MAGAAEKNGAAGEKLPRHIAIIMDGNGRWAKKRGLPRKAGPRRRRGDIPAHCNVLQKPRHGLSHGVCFLHGKLEALG